jgi:hypothetical protein
MSTKITIQTHVSTSAALKLGVTVAGDVEIPVTTEWLAALTERERVALKDYARPGGRGFLSVPAPTLDEVLTALRAKIAAKLAELDAIVAKYRDLPDDRLIMRRGLTEHEVRYDLGRIRDHAPELYQRAAAAAERATERAQDAARRNRLAIVERLEAAPDDSLISCDSGGYRPCREVSGLKDIAPALYQRAAAAAERATEREEAEHERAQRAKRQERASWLAEWGTESQRARDAEGLLPQDELRDAIREWLFASLAGQQRYRRLTAGDVSHSDYCDEDCEVSYSVTDVEGLTVDEYETLTKIRALVSQDTARLADRATVTARCHLAWPACEPAETDDYTVTRASAHVLVEYAGYKLSREYAL